MSSKYKKIRCKLNGRQSISIPVKLKYNGRYIKRDIDIMIRGFIKFSELQEDVNRFEGVEFQQELASRFIDRPTSYPILFSSDRITLKNGIGVITLLPRSEDLLEKTEDVHVRIQRYKDLSDEDIISLGEIREDEIISEREEEDNVFIKIETGKERQPYSVSIQVTVIDDNLFGQTVDRGIINDSKANDRIFDLISRDHFRQTSNFIVEFYNDEDWVPVVDNLIEKNDGTYNDVLSVANNLKNRIPFGASPMLDALSLSAETMSDNDIDDIKKLIYLFTDNASNASVVTLNESIEQINNIDGFRKVPVLIGNMSVVEPITLSVLANRTDTRTLNKISYLTGGQSYTIVDAKHTDRMSEIFYTEATGVLGYGTYQFIVDLGESVRLNSIKPEFYIPETGNAYWAIAVSEDGYNYINLLEQYSYDTSPSYNGLFVRYIKFFITFITGFDSMYDNGEFIDNSPYLRYFEINYNKNNKAYLYLNNKDVDLLPSQMVLAVNSNNKIDENIGDINIGLSAGDPVNWIDYTSPAYPGIEENGKIFVPIRYAYDTGKYEHQPLEKIDDYTLRAPYGKWFPDSSVMVYDKNHNVIPSDLYRIYSREGLVVFNYRLSKDYIDGDYKISILSENSYKIGLELLNKSDKKDLEIEGLSYMYTTGRELLPPIERVPPEVSNVIIEPSYVTVYDKISISYDYFDINFIEEDKSKTIIRWFINNTHVPYLDNLRIWNDIDDENDPLWKRVFTFSKDDLGSDESVIDKARLSGESILNLNDRIHAIIRVSDGELHSEEGMSNTLVVRESKPRVYQPRIVGIKSDGKVTNRIASDVTAEVRFNFYSDTDVNNSEIIWYVNDFMFKRGRYGQENSEGVLYQRIAPGEYGVGTTSDLGLQIGNEIYAVIIPRSENISGESISTPSYVVQNSYPVVGNIELRPEEPNTNQNLILSWDFFDFEIMALHDSENSIQSNRTSVQWWRRLAGEEWEKIYDNADDLGDIYVVQGYENMIDINNVRDNHNSFSVLDHDATRVGEQWKAIVVPNDSIDDGEPSESNIVNIRSV